MADSDDTPEWVRGDSRMVTPGKRALTAEFVRSILVYEPDTGLLRWKVHRPKSPRYPGDIAGCVTEPRGEVTVGIGSPPGNLYKATHIIWLIVKGEWPEHQIDHEDTNASNNRWTNLRPATHTQNQYNRTKLKNNTSGFKGVSLHRPSGKWFAMIRVDGAQNFLGAFDTAEEAGEAYRQAALKWHKEFARM